MNRRYALGAVAALAVGSSAHASMLGPVFTIQATSRAGTATYTIDQSQLHASSRADGGMEWTLQNPVALLGNSGATVGMLSTASFLLLGEQSVSLTFDVTAGGSMTTFMVTSPVVSFASIDPAEATASAGLSLTDNTGNGAQLFGEFDQPGAYQARYNGGTIFAALLGNFNAGNNYQTNTENDGTGPFSPVGTPVSSIQSEFKFSVSANDSAAGTSIFVVREQVPTPGSGALALAGIGFAVSRRRRA